MPSSDQCALGTDGKLLDESKIVWYNDAEDSVPIASAPAASQVLSTSSTLKATTLHSFFNGVSTPGPAVFSAGARRSSRVSKPSKRILDENNAELQAESSKRARITGKKPVQFESEDEASITHDSDVGGNTDVEMEDSITAEDAYTLTKAMGDQDRKVSAHHPNYPTCELTYISRFYVLGRSLIVQLTYEPSSSPRKNMLMQLRVLLKMDMYAQSASEYSFLK